MNILHFRYAVEVAKAGSINKAAEALLMGQPNLSRAIKELESTLGITIFDRSSKGMVPTLEGEEFLGYARKILEQLDKVKTIYSHNLPKKQTFSISVPRASYISYAFSEFAKKLSTNPAEIFYKETNAQRAVINILESDYKLGILRYAENYDRYYREMMDEKGLEYKLITSFKYVLLMNKSCPLAQLDDVRFSDLQPYIEIAHADPYVPYLPFATVKKDELPDNIERRIFVFERASQYELMSENAELFMWASPSPSKILETHGLVQKECSENKRLYKDVLIYRKDYSLTDLDNMFIDELMKAKHSFL